MTAPKSDPVNHPPHYTAHPSGVECIQITEHMNFNLGNAMKYIWRADEKGSDIQDLKKAAWYIARELARREKHAETAGHLRSTLNRPIPTPPVLQDRDARVRAHLTTT